MSKPNNGKGLAVPGESKTSGSPTRRARCVDVGDTIRSSRDFADFMSCLIGDIVSGRIDPRTANSACNAGGKLLRVVELEYRYGRKKQDTEKTLQLAGAST